MGINDGKFGYLKTSLENDFGRFLTDSKSIDDYLKSKQDKINKEFENIREARDKKEISDEDFINDYYFSLYGNDLISKKMAEIVLGKPANLVLLDNYYNCFKEHNISILGFDRMYNIFGGDYLISACDSNINLFEKNEEVSLKEIKSYAKNNQIKFINSFNSAFGVSSDKEFNEIVESNVNTLKNIYSQKDYYGKLYEHTCKKTRESLTDEVLKNDGREFLFMSLNQMRTHFDEHALWYWNDRDEGVVNTYYKTKELEKI